MTMTMLKRPLTSALIAVLGLGLLTGCPEDDDNPITNLSLAVQSPAQISSAESLAGDTVVMRAAVLNSGGTMTAGVFVRAVDTVTRAVYDRVIPGLALGQTATVSWTFNGVESPLLSGGEHAFRIIVDPLDTLPEPIKSDNVVDGARFTLAPLNSRIAVAPVATGGFSTVASTAPASIVWSLALDPATPITASRTVAWAVRRARDLVVVASGTATLSVGAQTVVTATWNFVAPGDVAGATEYQVILDPNSALPEANELDNVGAVTITWTVSA